MANYNKGRYTRGPKSRKIDQIRRKSRNSNVFKTWLTNLEENEMASVNKVIIVGNLGGDPETRNMSSPMKGSGRAKNSGMAEMESSCFDMMMQHIKLTVGIKIAQNWALVLHIFCRLHCISFANQ